MTARRGSRASRALTTILGYGVLIALALAMLFPYYRMVISAVKGPRGFTADPYSLIPKTFSLESIQYVWFNSNIALYLRNSLLYASIVLVVQSFINSLAAYAFSRIQFPGRETLFILILATMMLPYSVLLIPTYLTVWRLPGQLGAGVIPGFASAYGIFMLRQFFLNIPMELRTQPTDGANRFRIYWQVILPRRR